MSQNLDRARDYHEEIRQLLLQDWDPIGISHVPEAQDEYDEYIGEIYALLIRHEPAHRLFDHLLWIETKQMGLFASRRRIKKVVDELINLRNEIEAKRSLNRRAASDENQS